MTSPQWYKTMDLTELTPITLTNDESGKRFILADGNRRQIGKFVRLTPDNNRAYFIFDGKSSPISVDINALTGYKVYSIDKISKLGTYPLTPLPSDIQKNIAEYYGGRRKSRKTTKKAKKTKRIKRTKRKSKKSRKSRK
jgi:hypothetical protein